MAAPKAKARKPAPKKGAAARSESKAKAKTVDFRGLKLTLPTKIPGTLLWDINALAEGDADSLAGFIDLLSSLLGAEQSRAVRNKVRDDGLDLEETFTALEELMRGVFEASGLSQGE